MTHITAYKKDDTYMFSARGHAGYAEQGKDIVCAAISILLTTLAQELEHLADIGEAEIVTATLEPGDAYISCWVPEKNKSAIDTIITGLSLIANEYTEHCTLALGGGLEKRRAKVIHSSRQDND